AEDGIRDRTVTGVQTCALPIYGQPGGHDDERRRLQHLRGGVQQRDRQEEEEDGLGESRDQLAARAVIGEAVALELALTPEVAARSEERRVGKGGRCGRAAERER